MSDDIDSIVAEWAKRVDEKTVAIASSFDKGLVKSAFFCEGEAKKNAMDMIYNVSIPEGPNGPLWKRTGLYKASISSGLDPDIKHSAIVFNTVPYAYEIEYGSSDAYGSKNGGHQGRPIMTNSVFNNKENIKTILETYLKEVVK